MKYQVSIPVLLVLSVWFMSCGTSATQTRKRLASLEIPAVKGHSKWDKLLFYEGFTISYNPSWKIPNWVAYTLEAGETEGKSVRKGDNFRPDPSLSLPQADVEDYRRSGWDRGHMAPAGDMKWSQKAMDESFFFTNICPQNQTLNTGDWRRLEEKCRKYTGRFDKIHIICGPVVRSGENGTIGPHKVQVPDGFFKALLVKDSDSWQAIAFYFENGPTKRSLPSYAVSVDSIESVTGLDLFVNLPSAVESAVEAKVDFHFWFDR